MAYASWPRPGKNFSSRTVRNSFPFFIKRTGAKLLNISNFTAEGSRKNFLMRGLIIGIEYSHRSTSLRHVPHEVSVEIIQG